MLETTNREPVCAVVGIIGFRVGRIQVKVTSVIRIRRFRRRRPIVTVATLIVDSGIRVVTVTSEREIVGDNCMYLWNFIF